LEEGLSLYVFNHAEKHKFFREVQIIDFSVLKIVKELTKNLEVSSSTYKQWEKAILEGYKVFRELINYRGGTIELDLNKTTIVYKRL